MIHLQKMFKVSERKACGVVGQIRTTQRYVPIVDPARVRAHERIVELAGEYGRYGYKTITSMMQLEGFEVGRDAVHRVWREEGLQVPQKQPKRARLWLADVALVSGYDLLIAITYGVTTLFLSKLTTGENSKF